MTVTVFGGTGFLGTALVRRLVEHGTGVRVAARRPQGDFPAGLNARVEFVEADVRDPASVARALAGARGAVNAVGLYVESGQDSFDAVHVRGAGIVAEQAAMAALDILVHVSGIGADAASPSPYVRARAKGERAASGAFNGTVVARPSVLFGPGDSFLNTVDAITRAAPVFPLFGDGGTRLQPVFVGDVAEGIARIVERNAVDPRPFEFGGPAVLSYREIVTLVLRHRRRRRLLMPVPFALWFAQAALLGLLPSPPLTRDQVVLMQTDNVVGPAAATLADLGVTPLALEAALADCLPPAGR